MDVIATDGLTKYYGSHPGLVDLSLQAREGEIFGYLGPNGAGKTTTIRLLMDFIRPTRGKATVLGKDAKRESLSIRQDVGNLPGDVHLYDHMTGEEMLEFLARFRSKPSVFRGQLAERLDLDLSRKIKSYSKGMRQKLGIIQALMHDPSLLILDEPTVGLDPLMQLEFYQIIRDFKERGRTVFMSSHNLPEVERGCDRVGIIREGKLLAVEEIEALKQRRVKKIEVVFQKEVDEKDLSISGVIKTEGRDKHFFLYIKGNLDEVLKHLARFPIEDIVVEKASLEDIFLEFY